MRCTADPGRPWATMRLEVVGRAWSRSTVGAPPWRSEGDPHGQREASSTFSSSFTNIDLSHVGSRSSRPPENARTEVSCLDPTFRVHGFA
jgi:hypothetical protein